LSTHFAKNPEKGGNRLILQEKSLIIKIRVILAQISSIREILYARQGYKNSTFHQLFKPIFNKDCQKRLQKTGVDKYVKKLSALQLIVLIAFAQLEQLPSLRAISNSLNSKDLSPSFDFPS